MICRTYHSAKQRILSKLIRGSESHSECQMLLAGVERLVLPIGASAVLLSRLTNTVRQDWGSYILHPFDRTNTEQILAAFVKVVELELKIAKGCVVLSDLLLRVESEPDDEFNGVDNAQSRDVKIHDCGCRHNVLVSREAHQLVGLRYPKKSKEVRVQCDTRPQTKSVLSGCWYRCHTTTDLGHTSVLSSRPLMSLVA